MRTTIYVIAKAKFEAIYLSIPRLLPISQWHSMLAQGQSKSLDVLEAIEEIEDVKVEGEFVIPSGAIAVVILELCKADCVKSEYQIQATDFFFADLEANPPNLKGISPEIQKAWSLFLKVVDTSVIFRQSLPWWLQESARARSAYVGLLTPAESRLVNDLHNDYVLGWEPGT